MRAFLPLLILLAACTARPLTGTEKTFTASVMGDAIAVERVRLVDGSAVALLPAEIPVRPRRTCREKLQPPRTEPVPGTFPAFALGHRVFYAKRFWKKDFLDRYPQAMELGNAMRLAHELTHVWQWQARGITGYHPLKAAFEHIESNDPYLLTVDPGRPFLDYPYEQQGVLVEEFVCCRALDPDGARTERLHEVISQVFPQVRRHQPVPLRALTLPWDGAETAGICA